MKEEKRSSGKRNIDRGVEKKERKQEKGKKERKRKVDEQK